MALACRKRNEKAAWKVAGVDEIRLKSEEACDIHTVDLDLDILNPIIPLTSQQRWLGQNTQIIPLCVKDWITRALFFSFFLLLGNTLLCCFNMSRLILTDMPGFSPAEISWLESGKVTEICKEAVYLG